MSFSKDMSFSLDIVTEHQPEMRVASFSAYGTDPETEAWAIMGTWVSENAVMIDTAAMRCFGYICKRPAENGEYGYTVLVSIPDNLHVSDAVITEALIPAGTYISAVVDFTDDALAEGWKRLIEYAYSTGMVIDVSARHPLEENVFSTDGTKSFTLHLPVVCNEKE